MIAPIKLAIAGVGGAAFAIGAAVDSMLQPAASENNVVLYIAAMSSFVALCGVVVTGFVQWSASRTAIQAAREAREAAQESRDEARVAATVQKETTDKIEVLVNSKSDEAATTIKDLTEQIKQLNASALAKAEASPAVGTVPEPAATPEPVPIPVVVVDTEKPIEVIDKTPKKPRAKASPAVPPPAEGESTS